MGLILLLLPLGWCWLVLFNQLRLEWAVNPAYGYGYGVPLLCAYLCWERFKTLRTAPDEVRNSSRPALLAGAGCLALLWLPIRLLQEANPQWRLTSWLLACVVVGLTLVAAFHLGGRPLLRTVLFPVLFSLVAVPWPSVVEAPLIQGLAQLNAAASSELLGLAGYPALPHGNTVEIASGIVGVNEACSGIRSFQASLMISLFLGEVYRLALTGRLLFCLAGFGIALVLNACRTFILLWIAARRGVDAIANWHDPAGLMIFGGCLGILWLLAWLLSRRENKVSQEPSTLEGAGWIRPAVASISPWSKPSVASGLAAFAWFAAVEAQVEWWYRSHEVDRGPAVSWTVSVPSQRPEFRDLTIPDSIRQTLRYDEGVRAGWSGAGGSRIEIIFLRWEPGRVAAHLARGHSPGLCLPASGKTIVAASDLAWMELKELRLPFRAYTVRDGEQVFMVYHFLWQDRSDLQFFETEDIVSWRSRLANVWNGRRNLGQRLLEVGIWGIADPAAARSALKREMEQLVVVQE